MGTEGMDLINAICDELGLTDMKTVLDAEVEATVDMSLELVCERQVIDCPNTSTWMHIAICETCGPLRLLYCDKCAEAALRSLSYGASIWHHACGGVRSPGSKTYNNKFVRI